MAQISILFSVLVSLSLLFQFPFSVTASYISTVIPSSQCGGISSLQSLRGDRFVICDPVALTSNGDIWRIPADESIAPHAVWNSNFTTIEFTVDERSGYLFAIAEAQNRITLTTLNFFNTNGGYTPPPFILNSTTTLESCSTVRIVPNPDTSSSQDFNVTLAMCCIRFETRERIIYVVQNVLSSGGRGLEMTAPPTCLAGNSDPILTSDGANIIISCVPSEYYTYPLVITNNYNISSRTRFTIPCPYLRRLIYRSYIDTMYVVCASSSILSVQHPCDENNRSVSVVVSANDCVGVESMAFDADPTSAAFVYSCYGFGKFLSSPLYSQPIMIASVAQCAAPGFYATYMTFIKGVVTVTCFSGVLSLYPGAYSSLLMPSRCSFPVDMELNTVTGDLFQACWRDSPVARIRDAQYQEFVSEDDCATVVSLAIDTVADDVLFACAYPAGAYRVPSDGSAATDMELVISDDDCNFPDLYADSARRLVYAICTDKSVLLVNMDQPFNFTTIFPPRQCAALFAVVHLAPYTYFSCDTQGLFSVIETATPITNASLSLVIDGAICAAEATIAHEASGTLFVACEGNGLWKYVPSIGISSFTQVLTVPGCNVTTIKILGDQLIGQCNYDYLIGYPLDALVAATAVNTVPSIHVVTECTSIISSYVRDPLTDALYTDCSDAGIAVSGQNFACYAGTEYKVGACEQCTVGKHRNRTHILARQLECELCPSGTVSTTIGAVACEVCQPGYYQVSPYISCKPCGIGAYSSDYGASECTPCASGYFGNSSRLNSSDCSGICGAGFWCGEGSTKASQMPCGSASVYCPSGSSEPLPVGAGYYGTNPVIPGTASTQQSRQQCSIGMYCDGSGIARPCPPGRFANTTGTEDCKQCDVGKWSDGLRRSASGAVIVDPVSGQSVQGATACEPCAPGSFTAQSGTIVCSLCSPGFSQPDRGATICQGCIPGHSAPESGYSTCPQCAVGRATSDLSAISCSQCSPGRHASSNGSLTCDPCDAGWFSADFGSASCSQCTPGRFSDAQGAASCQACSQGSASNATALDKVCPPCPPGSSQSLNGQESCELCPPKKYASSYGSLVCATCPFATSVDRTSCSSSPCDANEEYDSDTGECIKCGIGLTASKGGACSLCPQDTYTPAIGSGCTSCSELDGLSCAGGRITVKEGYWAYQVVDAVSGLLIYQSKKCPEGHCKETVLQQEFFQNQTAIALGLIVPLTHSPQCVFPRLDSTDNTLCGACVDGYMSQGDSCVACESANGGLLFLYFILSIVLVLFLYRSASSESTAGHSVVLIYFAQTAMLEVSSVKEFLQWLKVVNFNGTSDLGSTCLLPMTAYQQYLVSIIMPLFLLVELAALAFIHRAISAFVKTKPAPSEASTLSTSEKFVQAFSDFEWSRYVGGGLSILLFCYTQATTTCIRYIDCVVVGDSSVVFTDPSINCHSDEYKRYLVPIVFAIVLYVVLFPVLAFAFLASRYRAFNARAERQRSQSDLDNTRDHVALSPAFFMRYGILFQAFSAHAWYYQVIVLFRRAAFVLLSVLLTQSERERSLSFIMLNVVALCLHTYIKPFADQAVNASETFSTLVLLVVSAVITAYVPPYPMGAQVILFLLIVPTIAFLVLQVIRQNAVTIQSKFRKSLSKRSSLDSNDQEAMDTSPRQHAISTSQHVPRAITGPTPSADVELAELSTISPVIRSNGLTDAAKSVSVDSHSAPRPAAAAGSNATALHDQLMSDTTTSSDQYEL